VLTSGVDHAVTAAADERSQRNSDAKSVTITLPIENDSLDECIEGDDSLPIERRLASLSVSLSSPTSSGTGNVDDRSRHAATQQYLKNEAAGKSSSA